MAKSLPDIQATHEWQDLTTLPGYAEIADQTVTLQAKAGKFNHVYFGGSAAPDPRDGLALPVIVSVTGTSDHIWVRGTGRIAILLED
jgi:hypothetical protein